MLNGSLDQQRSPGYNCMLLTLLRHLAIPVEKGQARFGNIFYFLPSTFEI